MNRFETEVDGRLHVGSEPASARSEGVRLPTDVRVSGVEQPPLTFLLLRLVLHGRDFWKQHRGNDRQVEAVAFPHELVIGCTLSMSALTAASAASLAESTP